MACEDWPCCGHELGCCPDYDASGRQLNMRCTCGAVLPLNRRFSICDTCLNRGDEDTRFDEAPDDDWDDEEDMDEDTDGDPGDMDGDHDSNMRDIGWGTDEDYGYDGGYED